MSFSDLAALTIHDVKNQLAQLASDAEQRGDGHSLCISLNASEALTRLLCYYRSEEKILAVNIEPESPEEMISDLLRVLKKNCEQRPQIQIKTTLELAPAVWFYDKVLIQMILNNALQNALRYAASTVNLNVIEQDHQLEIRIQDDGEGYPQATLEEADHLAPISAEGTGLGLRLARRVVEQHIHQGRSGRIVLSNHTGAQFSLFLP